MEGGEGKGGGEGTMETPAMMRVRFLGRRCTTRAALYAKPTAIPPEHPSAISTNFQFTFLHFSSPSPLTML
jgi:hypothetical protein